MSVMPKKFGGVICPPGFAFGRAAGFFGRWIRCQHPFPVAVGRIPKEDGLLLAPI